MTYHQQSPKAPLRQTTVVIAAIDDAHVDAALAVRANAPAHWDVHVLDVSRAAAPGAPQTDARGVHCVTLDTAWNVVAEPPLRASALLADWVTEHVIGDGEGIVLVLPADGGVAHFTVAQRAQGLAAAQARIGVYLATEPAVLAVGRDHMLADTRVLELSETTRKSVERADALLISPTIDAGALRERGWELPQTQIGAIDAEQFAKFVEQLEQTDISPVREFDAPFISVCITHHERPALLLQTLASIERQQYSPFEVILVDDGSKSPQVHQLLDELQPVFDARGWTIVRQENKYLGAARNSAVRNAKGEFLLFIDDDDCMRSGYIETFARAALFANADIVTCFLEYFEGVDEPRDGVTKIHHRWVMPGPIGAGSLVQNTYGGANALVRRSLYDAIGGYTEDHGIGYEDWEFYNRALAYGAHFEVVPRPLLWCRWGIGGMQSTTRKHVQQHSRASRPVREKMPAAFRDLPHLVQGLYARNRDLLAHIERVEKKLAQLEQQPNRTQVSAERPTGARNASHDPEALPPRVEPSSLPRHRCHIWHTEGLGLSGILSWMWRLRRQFAPSMNMDLRLVDLAVLPYGFQQAGADPSQLYDERIATSEEFLAFLQRNANDVHVVNHAFPYLKSMLEQLGPETLRQLKLVGVCHTDQDYYYQNLELLAPVLRSIIAVSPTCAATLAKRIPQYASRIVTLPAWAVQLPAAPAHERGAGDPLRLLYTGRILHFQKRVFDLVELATRLRAARVNAELTIVGDGPDRDELEKRIRAAGARAIPVNFAGVRAPWEMDELLLSHHAFVQVSEFEGASVSLMEALAYGLVPAVTVTRSGHDLLRSDHNALTAPVGDMKKLTAQLALLERDRHRHTRLAAAARATAETYLAELAYPQRFASLVHAVATSPLPESPAANQVAA